MCSLAQVFITYAIICSKKFLVNMLVGNHTLAAVRGQESYPLFSEAFKATFDEVNSFKKSTIEVDEKTYKVDLYFVVDYKVFLTYKSCAIIYNIQFTCLSRSLCCLCWA